MNQISNNFHSIEQVAGQYLNQKQIKAATQNEKNTFADILKEKVSGNSQELKFSKHASARLEARNISLTQEQNERLENGVSLAEEKGIRDTLVVVDSLSFIVNVPNKTVVTAMNQTDSAENVYTNIDGAVIM